MATRRRHRVEAVQKTELERAAIAACTVLNRECPCAKAPGTCQTMVSAMTAAMTEIAPEVLMRIYNAKFARPRT